MLPFASWTLRLCGDSRMGGGSVSEPGSQFRPRGVTHLPLLYNPWVCWRILKTRWSSSSSTLEDSTIAAFSAHSVAFQCKKFYKAHFLEFPADFWRGSPQEVGLQLWYSTLSPDLKVLWSFYTIVETLVHSLRVLDNPQYFPSPGQYNWSLELIFMEKSSGLEDLQL